MKHFTLSKLTYLTGIIAVASLGLFTAGVVSADTTYIYENMNGELQTIQADSATEALTSATDIKYNSGVITATEYEETVSSSDTGDTTSDQYLYVSADGDIEIESADTASDAIMDADDRRTTSGVIDAEVYYDLANDTTVSSSGEERTYAYITMDGSLAYEMADYWQDALATANNIRYNSGVMAVSQ